LQPIRTNIGLGENNFKFRAWELKIEGINKLKCFWKLRW
jgi:hypothetical protein